MRGASDGEAGQPGGELGDRAERAVVPDEPVAPAVALLDEKGIQVVETLEQENKVLHYSLVSKFPVPGPDGRPLPQTGTLPEVVVSDGKVFFSLTVDAAAVKAWEPVRKRAEEAVRAYHGELQKLGMKPIRPLEEDLKESVTARVTL